MDLKQEQIWSREQVVVLRALAAAAGRQGCKFLEVGSWCGDSTVVIAQVAQECGGHVFCVDWWKGNVGTSLSEIASNEDVFAFFWDRIRRLGLEDVVIPIRGPSSLAAQVLAKGTFDFIFLDADHGYEGVLSDIRQYIPLVRPAGGILCGHDCEGRIADYDPDFLETGKHVDFHESVHCGVVLAVGSSFADYAVDHGIWSVQAGTAGNWEPTQLELPSIQRRRQPPTPPLGHSRSYNVIRYGRHVYAVPYSSAAIDLTALEDTLRDQFPFAPSMVELEELLGEKIWPGSGPAMLETYKFYNILRYNDRLFAFAQGLGPLILPQLNEQEIEEFRQSGNCVIGDSVEEVKKAIDQLIDGPEALQAAVRGKAPPQDMHQPQPLTPVAKSVDAQEKARAAPVQCAMQLILCKRKPRAKVSIILLDWGVRESFHSLEYLNKQTVPRDEYELIWVEFYNRKPLELEQLVHADPAVLDKWLVLGYPQDTYYHKHRMYNAGIILAEGEICVFCDSDAIFQPTFIENLLKGFADNPNAVLHLDEVRNYSKKYYPFNYPSLEQVLGDGCVNWTGSTTSGLDNSPDMLHAANYGACMAARRSDLIRVGGADEHIDYLGYICGPYELTFRLVNFGRHEHWLRNEYLYHVWHPNTSGCNVEYKGPDDCRGMSLRALQTRDRGRIEPYTENPAITELRRGSRDPLETLLTLLVRDDAGQWQLQTVLQNAGPQLMENDYYGFNIIYFRGSWYGLSQREGHFDPTKVQNREYAHCYCAATRNELQAVLPVRLRWVRLQLYSLLRHLPFARRLKEKIRRRLQPAPRKLVQPADRNPQLIEEGYYDYNIIYYRGTWYALDQEEGGFDPARAQKKEYAHCYSAVSEDDLQAMLPVGPRWLRRFPLARRLLRGAIPHSPRKVFPRHDNKPHLVEETYYGFNIIYFRGTWYGLGQDEGSFDPEKLQAQQYRRCLTGETLEQVKLRIRRQRTIKRRVKDLAKKMLRLACLTESAGAK